MAKARDTNIFKFKEVPSLMDYLFGTDSEDYKKNKSFRLNSIIQLINGVNGINNLQFVFSDRSNPLETDYDKGFFFTNTNEVNLSNFAKLIINKSPLQSFDLTELFLLIGTLENVVLKIENPSNPTNVFNLEITNVTQQDSFFVLDVIDYKGFCLGELINETIYSFYFDIKVKNIKKTSDLENDGNGNGSPFATIEEAKSYAPTFNPTFVNPLISISLNQATREVGESYSSTITANFYRGEIRGLNVDGAWDTNTFQNHRAGLATSYTLDGITQPSNSKTVTRILILGNNTFNGSVTFEEGAQPRNNKDDDFSTPYPAGSLSSSINVLARKKTFHGIGNAPTNSAQVRALANSVFDTQNNFSINLSTTKYSISIPAEKTLVSVITQNNENITGNFTLTTFNVNDAGSGSYSYKVYTFESAIPLELTANVILS